MKVLFLSQDGKLGDAIVNTAFVAALARGAPGCEIHATVAGATAVFWRADRRLARLWPLQRPGWAETVRTALALRRERYDYIVTWQRLRKEKNKLLLWLARPGRVIDLRDWHRAPPRQPQQRSNKIADCGAALDQMGVPLTAPLAYEIGMPAVSAALDALLPAGAEVIALNLFAADAERNVAPAPARQLLQGLRAQAPQALLCLVCTDATVASAQAVLAASGVAGLVINCEGDLARLLRLCQRADLVISPDTALIHIASAYDTAVIGIYQNNGVKALQWGPRSTRSACVLSDNPDSIAGFAVEQVLAQAQALRAQAGAAAGQARA